MFTTSDPDRIIEPKPYKSQLIALYSRTLQWQNVPIASFTLSAHSTHKNQHLCLTNYVLVYDAGYFEACSDYSPGFCRSSKLMASCNILIFWTAFFKNQITCRTSEELTCVWSIFLQWKIFKGFNVSQSYVKQQFPQSRAWNAQIDNCFELHAVWFNAHGISDMTFPTR